MAQFSITEKVIWNLSQWLGAISFDVPGNSHIWPTFWQELRVLSEQIEGQALFHVRIETSLSREYILSLEEVHDVAVTVLLGGHLLHQRRIEVSEDKLSLSCEFDLPKAKGYKFAIFRL